MSKAKKVLAEQLVAAVEPHLGSHALATLPPKAVAKTLRKLAKTVLKQQAKAAKLVPAPSAAKQTRKALAGELAGALQPYLGTEENLAAAPTKAITKTIKRLATAVVKQRRKQAKKAAKATKAAASGAATEPATQPQAARVKPAAPARRAPAKRPAPKATPAKDAAPAPNGAADA
ncbi:MAG: hypothetical protein ACRYFZ_01840 [Janthinobacterium lividum]